MNVRELHNALSKLYPKTLSCSWDNDGIMVSPDPGREVKRVLVSLDATDSAIQYAIANGFDTLVTHHPMIFRGIKSVTENTLGGRRVLDSVLGGLSVMSFHTRLDAADGGVNDALADILGYNPTGRFGDDESPELGRIIDIETMTAKEFAGLVRDRLGCTAVRLNGDPDKKINRVALCGGDGKDFVYPALTEECDLFLTGDAGYNMTGDASEEGLVTIEAGHYHTEAPVCRVLAEKIHEICGADTEIYNSCTYTLV